MKRKWHEIHDFMDGWGFCEHIPDNEIVREDHPNDPIPWKVVSSKKPVRHIWHKDAEHFLNIDIFAVEADSDEFLDGVYEKLVPLLQEQYEKMQAYYDAHPIKFDKITIPKINRLYPKSIL